MRQSARPAAQQKILVIGGSGFFGRHTIRALVQAGAEVFATHSPGKPAPAEPACAGWLRADLADENCCANWSAPFDTVIYLAQARSWRNFPDDAAGVFQVNVASLLRAAEYARVIGARFVYASSGTVYSQTLRPARENEPLDPAAPRSFYAASKLSAELLLGPFQQCMPVIVLRFFVPYGAGQDQAMLIPRLVHNVRHGVPIILHGHDGLRCNPLAVQDAADVLRSCVELPGSHTLNVAGPEVLTLRQVGEHIGRVVDVEPKFELKTEQPAAVIVGDTSALRATLGWVPATTFECGLRSWLAEVATAA